MVTPTTVPIQRLRELLLYDPKTGVFRWRIARGPCPAGAVAGTVNARGYRRIHVDGVSLAAHRIAWAMMTGKWPVMDIDHRRGGGDNNRWRNLREATESQNLAISKLRKDNTSGFKGVRPTKSGRYEAYIWFEGKSQHLGTYSTPKRAHAAYMRRARELWGVQFARAA